jgi:hypothetical protein
VDTSCHVLKLFTKCMLVVVENTERFMSVTPAGIVHIKIKIIFFHRLSRRLLESDVVEFSTYRRQKPIRRNSYYRSVHTCTLSSFPRRSMELAHIVVY